HPGERFTLHNQLQDPLLSIYQLPVTPALGDVAVGFQHAPDTVGVADDLVARGDDELPTVLGPVADFAFPAPAGTKFRLDLGPRRGMDGSQQFVRTAAEHLRFCKAVQLLRAAAPAL